MLCVDIGIWCDNLWNYFNWINTKSCWPFTPSIAFFFSTMKNTQTKWFSTAEELCNYHGVAAAAVAHDTFFTTQSMNVYWKGNPSVRLAAPISCYNIYEPCVFVVVSCACVFIWLMEFSPLFYVFAKDTSACLHGCRTGAHNTNLCIQTHIQSIQKHRGKPAIQAVVRLRPCATACFCALPQRVTMTHPQLAKDITSTLRIQWYTIYEHIRYAPNRYGKKGEPEWRKPMVLRFSSVVFFLGCPKKQLSYQFWPPVTSELLKRNGESFMLFVVHAFKRNLDNKFHFCDVRMRVSAGVGYKIKRNASILCSSSDGGGVDVIGLKFFVFLSSVDSFCGFSHAVVSPHNGDGEDGDTWWPWVLTTEYGVAFLFPLRFCCYLIWAFALLSGVEGTSLCDVGVVWSSMLYRIACWWWSRLVYFGIA